MLIYSFWGAGESPPQEPPPGRRPAGGEKFLGFFTASCVLRSTILGARMRGSQVPLVQIYIEGKTRGANPLQLVIRTFYSIIFRCLGSYEMLRFLASKLRRSFIQEHKSEGINVNTDRSTSNIMRGLERHSRILAHNASAQIQLG